MEEAGGDTVSEALKAEIAAAMADGRDIVVTAGATDWRTGPFGRLAGAAEGARPTGLSHSAV